MRDSDNSNPEATMPEYEFTVALNGKHFFSTDRKRCKDSADARRVAAALAHRFSEADGYSLSLSVYRSGGNFIELDGGNVEHSLQLFDLQQAMV